MEDCGKTFILKYKRNYIEHNENTSFLTDCMAWPFLKQKSDDH